jgi:glutathione S-transferase
VNADTHIQSCTSARPVQARDCACFAAQGVSLSQTSLPDPGRPKLDPRVAAVVAVNPEYTEALGAASQGVAVLRLSLGRNHLDEGSAVTIPNASAFDALAIGSARGRAILLEEKGDGSLCVTPVEARQAITLPEKDVRFDRVNIDLSARPDWSLALSSTGKVPALKMRQPGGEDAVLFESMVICRYLEETQAGAAMYPRNPLLRARHRAWIEYATLTMGDGWQFLHAVDAAIAATRRVALRAKLAKPEAGLGDGPYFARAEFGMVDAVYAPLLRYFGIVNPAIAQGGFQGLPRVLGWRAAWAARPSVRDAVVPDYTERFLNHLRQNGALAAA